MDETQAAAVRAQGNNRTMLGDLESTFKVDETAPIEEPALEPEAPEESGFAPEEAVPPVVEPVAEVKDTPPPGFIPLAAALDDRDKRKAAERERDEALKQLQQFRQQQAGEAPSIYDDPVAWEAQQAAKLEAIQFATTERISERFAKQAHGAEALEAAKQWGIQASQADPYFKARYMAQEDPFGWLIAEQKRDLIAQDPDAYARKWAEDNGYVASQAQPPAAPPVQPVAAPVAPPRSIASAPSSSGVTHTPVTSVMEAATFHLG